MKNTSRSARVNALIPENFRRLMAADYPTLLKNLEKGGALADVSDFLKSEEDRTQFLGCILYAYVQAKQIGKPKRESFHYGHRAKVAEAASRLLEALRGMATQEQAAKLDVAAGIANDFAKTMLDAEREFQGWLDLCKFPNPRTTQTKTDRDRRLWFALALSQWFSKRTGKPRNKIAAAIATDAFNDVMRSKLAEAALKAKRGR